MKRIKCYIYGAGREYDRLSSYLKMTEKIEILAVVTTEKQRFSSMDHIPCITAKDMDIAAVDYIIIAVEDWKPIAQYLRTLGVGDDMLLRSCMFYNPNFDLEEYIKLKNSKVSILSNWCLGGVVYRRLGLKAFSPTIDMFCQARDYMEFVDHYEYYLSMDMQLCPETVMTESNLGPMPRGILGNKVVWNFNHTDNPERTVSKWNIARKSVNFDNIAVLMLIGNDEEAYWFDALNIKKKLGVYYKELNLPSVICCHEWKDPALKARYDYNWGGYTIIQLINDEFAIKSRINWIDFLNGKENFLRY